MEKVLKFAQSFVRKNGDELDKWSKTKGTVSQKFRRLRNLVEKDPGYKEAASALGPVVTMLTEEIVIIVIIIIIVYGSGIDSIDFSRF
jgi:hypothetical protein